jgi:flagellar motor switch/type III secretory pathway protein FliN
LLRLSVARLLGEEFELGWADAGMDATLRGAGAALVLDICRQLSRGEAPELSGPLEEPSAPAFGCRLTVHVRGKPYAVAVELEATSGGLASGCQMLTGRLGALGAVPIALPWVCAVSEATVGLVQMLSVGDVWLPGDGWVDASDPLSAGVLALPLANSGLPVRVSAGRTVLGPQPVPVHPQLELSMNQDPSEVEQIVSEAPLVVRLEVGSLEMSATEWAALRPGDVVQSGRRIEDAVILRCAGREIARGELVEVEGEIGVRVTHVGGSSAHA